MPEEVDETLFRALLHASLPIDEIQGLIGLGAKEAGPLDTVVLIWIDDQDRPDFRNTVAAHNKEQPQSGSFQFSWLYRGISRNTRLLLRIEMEKPTRATFHLCFSLKQDFGVLWTMAQSRTFWLVPGPVRPLSAPRVAMEAATFFEEYKSSFEWMLAFELSKSQANDLREFLAVWPYRPHY